MDLLGAQAAADAVVAFEDEDPLALLAEQGCGDQRVDAAADDDIVMGAHGVSSPEDMKRPAGKATPAVSTTW